MNRGRVFASLIFVCGLLLAQPEENKQNYSEDTRYLLYDVNPGEGFNLRRDVYLRMANLVKLLNKVQSWVLVLPPWNHLYHWNSDIEQQNIPWSLFFDIESLAQHVPVIEFEQFLKANHHKVDEVIYFQHYKEGWNGNGWVEKMDERDCINKVPFYKDDKELWHWYLPNVTALEFKCMSIQAEYSFLKDFLLTNTSSKSIYFPRAEHVMHGKYSEWSKEFWTARRSVRFSRGLINLADDFRMKFLDSSDAEDKTFLGENWQYVKKKHGDAIGGPYLAIHLRRRDFIFSHKKDIPSISGAASQINKALMNLNLSKVYIATDAPAEEIDQLEKNINMGEMYKYSPTEDVFKKYMDGGIAIIDQWICAHARFFIGTAASTFSFRIHEEREILGFTQNSTYNCFCPDDKPACEQPTKWSIIYKN